MGTRAGAASATAELARLKGIGAAQLHEVHTGAHWVTLADPEGNEFDLIEG